jgi:succinate dehydrogenase hydrophobic anchor subunit
VRQEWLLLRVTSVVLILLAGAMAVFIALMIAGYH